MSDPESLLAETRAAKMDNPTDSRKPVLESTDARNKIEDLSRIAVEPGQNPYEAFIRACNNDPVSLFNMHWER